MSFLKRIKDSLNDRRQNYRDLIYVDRKSLLELVDNFERLDSAGRGLHDHKNLAVNLRCAIEAVYHDNGKNGETTLLIIMETLIPLMEHRQKAKAMTALTGVQHV